eukprot:Hpha_TRINITY_DN33711_c0_g1::TRINITY_DN33711_c0_g1_i1::g.25150::m.25150
MGCVAMRCADSDCDAQPGCYCTVRSNKDSCAGDCGQSTEHCGLLMITIVSSVVLVLLIIVCALVFREPHSCKRKYCVSVLFVPCIWVLTISVIGLATLPEEGEDAGMHGNIFIFLVWFGGVVCSGTSVVVALISWCCKKHGQEDPCLPEAAHPAVPLPEPACHQMVAVQQKEAAVVPPEDSPGAQESGTCKDGTPKQSPTSDPTQPPVGSGAVSGSRKCSTPSSP